MKGMKLRTKLFITATLSVVALILLTIFILFILIIGYIDKEEINTISENYTGAMTIFAKEEDSLMSVAKDWSMWDDTYNFIKGDYKNFIGINLQDETMLALKLNFMSFVDIKGKYVFSKKYELAAEDESTFDAALMNKLKEGISFGNSISLTKPFTGLVVISGKPMFISAASITTSDGEAPYNGILVIGRYVNQEFIDYLQKVLLVDVTIDVLNTNNKVIKEGHQRLSDKAGDIWLKKNYKNIVSYSYVKNAFGKEAIVLGFDMKRENYRNGLFAIHYFSIAFFIALLLVASGLIIAFNRTFLRRLEKLHLFLDSVRKSKDTSASINMPGNDEISRLAANANMMLREIDSFYEEIRVMEERFRLILEATNDGYFDADFLKNEFYISPSWLKYIGYPEVPGYVNYSKFMETIHPDDKEVFGIALEDCLNGRIEHLRVESRVQKKSGEWLWIVVRGKIVEFDHQGKPIRLMGTISDISKRKKYEEQNTYLSQTDVVTNLKNRAYMEAVFKKADANPNPNSWIIMGDLNGLKLINDSFGHHEGDRLLYAVGEILRKCCSKDDIPARWGGDEFIVYIKDNAAEYVENLINNIKREAGYIVECATPISIALGRAQRSEEHGDMSSVLRQAEERMYRNKLLESRSARSSILASLEQSLHEKHIETEEHTKRIKNMCAQIGVRMRLLQEEMDELSLLGVLHDIGKIGIPESILLKPDKLTPEEWEIMKTHSEIGYRIAIATPDLAYIANDILSHHERFDGTGYPQGLRGKSIPKLSRLLSIVDSFDVMTHERPYKKPMSLEDAVQELRACAGKQFDPEMVEQFLTLLSENAFDNI